MSSYRKTCDGSTPFGSASGRAVAGGNEVDLCSTCWPMVSGWGRIMPGVKDSEGVLG